MRLYNSQSRQVEEFTIPDRTVRLYVCGITPYDTTHLGHAFTYASFDVLIRYLEWQQVQVRYAQNVTDIDDDVLKKAGQVGEDWRELGNRWTRHFIDDMRTLNIRPPDFYPRATEVMPEIVEMDRKLLEKGVAYEANGSVYFNVASFGAFGQLSHIPRAEMLPVANERGNRPDDPNKRDPLDFVLWQRRAEREPGWESPWGEGRPGWHIECSTMATRFLGPSIDIHGGGGDLIFPHHECEIAQSESATGVAPFSRFWMHIAMVRMDGEKMSKSLGNLVMVSDLIKTFTPDTLRLYLASYHYRDSWEYNLGRLEFIANMAERWRVAVAGSDAQPQGSVRETSPVHKTFQQAMDNDLDTPAAITQLDELANELLGDRVPDRERFAAQGTLRELAGIFGMRLGAKPEDRVARGWEEHRAKFE